MAMLQIFTIALPLLRVASAGFASGIVITSTQKVGDTYKSTHMCFSEPLRDLNGKISTDFTVTPNGASWTSSTVIFSMDAQPSLMDPVDMDKPLGLQLTLGFVPSKLKSYIYATAVPSSAEISDDGMLDTASPFCGVQKPGCVKAEKCYSMKPPYGWSTMETSSRTLSGPTVNLNLTGLVDPKDVMVQVWSLPVGVDKNSHFETPVFTVLNWRFLNLEGSAVQAGGGWAPEGGEDSDEDYSSGFAAGGQDSGESDTDYYSGGPAKGSDIDDDDVEDEDAPPPTMITMSSLAERRSCPGWQHMSCMLDVLEKTCSREGSSPTALLSKKSTESVYLCCCPYPYKSCPEGDRSEVCDAAMEKYIAPLGEKPKKSAMQAAVQKARGYVRDNAGGTCGTATAAAEPATVCGSSAKPPVRRLLERQDLFCEVITWQSEEMGDGSEDEFEANGCPWPKHAAKPGEANWREGGKADWSGK